MSIITSLVDNDLYKFTMANAIFCKFPDYMVSYKFTCRNNATWTTAMLEKLNNEINNYCDLEFGTSDISYIRSLGFFHESFIQFLKIFKPRRDHITVCLVDNKLELNISGPWYMTVFYEVPLLSMINEIYFQDHDHIGGIEKLEAKIKILKENPDIKFADFGTRRRLSNRWQYKVLTYLKDCPGFVGTSNVYFAKLLQVKPIGTMAHEWIMAGAGRSDSSFIESQKSMLQTWIDVYRGNLGIALTDTYGMDKFIEDFDLYFAKLYDGLRHDSGDPIEWAKKAIKMYEDLGIDPCTKQFVFSDGLTVNKAVEIHEFFERRFCGHNFKLSFGIGTHFTNDFDNLEPLRIVIKMTECNNSPTIKISDESAKVMCEDEHFKRYAIGVMCK